MSKGTPRSETEERAILGVLLFNPQKMDDCLDLDPDDFYGLAHNRIFMAMRKIWREGVTFDLPAVWEEIKEEPSVEKIGGARYLAGLLNDFVSEATAPKHIETVKKLSRDRNLLDAVDSFRLEVLDGHADQAVSAMQSALTASMKAGKVTWATIGEMAEKRAQEIEDLLSGAEVEASFIPTGIPGLDLIINGWAVGDLAYIAARPSLGKSALAIQSAVEVAGRGFPAVFGSAEMSKASIMNRVLAYKTHTEHRRLRQNDKKTLMGTVGPAWTVAGEFSETPLIVDDRSILRPADLWWMARKCIKKWGSCSAIFADYIQLMRPNEKNESKEREVSSISADLKAIARDLNVPVIALSQLSRDIEKRTKKDAPLLADLKWSGDTEQDADEVLFLWSKDDPERDNIDVRLTVGKQRNGPLGTVRLRFDKPTQRFAQEDTRRGGAAGE